MQTDYVEPTGEELKELGLNDPWHDVPPWQIPGIVTKYRERKAEEERQRQYQPAEEEPFVLSEAEEAALAAHLAEKAERISGAQQEALAVSDDGWQDMTKRPNEWLQIVNRQDIPDRAVRVAVALASFGGTGNTQDVFPTIGTLTEMMPKKRRAVADGVADLRKADLIREQSRVFNGPVTYKLGANTTEGGSQ